MRINRTQLTVIAALAGTTACLPYSLASTAQPVPVGEKKTTSTMWFLPNGLGNPGDTARAKRTLRGFDVETRWGIDDDADFGVRATSGQGIVLSYKRRIAGFADPDSSALAWELGGGIVNWGEHALGTASLIASGPKRGGANLDAGARVMHVLPLNDSSATDKPSIGGVFGARLTLGDETIIPELAIYHDPSALHIRKSSVVFVPSVSFTGSSLLKGLGGFGRMLGLADPAGRTRRLPRRD
jgi:hypothetical protein